MKYSEVSKFLKKSYGEDNFKEVEKDFMEAVRSLMFWLSTDESDPMQNSYDSSNVLNALEKIVDNFNKVYHYADITTSWTEEDDEND